MTGSVAIVGYGAIAAIHADLIHAEGHRIHWVIGPVPESARAFADRVGAPHWSTSLADALADPAVAAVVVASPNTTHAPVAAAALRQGKYVLCEVPLATSLDDAHSLAALAAAEDLVLMVCHTHRYQRRLRALKRLAASGETEVDHVLARYLLDRRGNHSSSGRPRSWQDSLLWHHLAHSLDIVLWLLDVRDPAGLGVHAVAGRPVDGSPLELDILLTTPTGQVASVTGSYQHAGPQVYDYVVTGRDHSYATVGEELHRDGEPYHLDPTDGPDEPDERLLQDRDFFDVVRGRTPCPLGAEEVLPVMQLLDVIEKQLLGTDPSLRPYDDPTRHRRRLVLPDSPAEETPSRR